MVLKSATLVEAVQAFVLLEINYRKKNYIPNTFVLNDICRTFLRFIIFLGDSTIFWSKSKTTILVVNENRKVIATVSVSCNKKKLCIENLFGKNIRELRRTTSSNVYFGKFAIAEQYIGTRMCVRILRELIERTKALDIEMGICVVHPHHCRLYERMGFFFKASSEIMPGMSKEAKAVLMFIKVAEASL